MVVFASKRIDGEGLADLPCALDKKSLWEMALLPVEKRIVELASECHACVLLNLLHYIINLLKSAICHFCATEYGIVCHFCANRLLHLCHFCEKVDSEIL